MEYELPNLEAFEDIDLLGTKGEFEIHKIRHKKTEVIYCAYVLTNNLEDIGRNQAINLYRELTIFPNLNHPSISKFYFYCPVDFSNYPRPVIITEFCPSLSLHQIFTKDSTHKLKLIYGICAGMSYLHSRNILHRDLKADTIFLNDRLFPKISCFHLCKQVDPGSQEKSQFIKGTPAYLAPEVFCNQEYSKSSDVYAFSLIVYQIMTNEENFFPQFNEKPGFLRQFVINGGRPSMCKNVPNCYQKLIEKCWSHDPRNRPTFDEILNQLKNDRDFIIDGVSEKEFYEFVKTIDEPEISFDSTPKINHLDFDLDSRSYKFNFCVQTIFDTQFDSMNMYMYYFDLKSFLRERKIGKGRFSEIYEIFYHELNNDNKIRYLPFAAKIYNEKLEDIYDLFSQEIIINTQLNHPCINRFIGYSPISFGEKKYPVAVFDCCSNSSLDKLFLLERKKIQFPNWNETTKLIIIYGIAAGMAYIHSQNIIHRDLNPTNIFLDMNLFPKIGDFGTADFYFNNNKENEEESDYYQSFVVNRTPLYMAPELLIDNQSSKASDVFSFAMIIYELITNEIPFNGLNHYEIVKGVVENKRPSFINKEKIPSCYQDLIQNCWQQDPNKRPTFEEIKCILKTDKSFITKGINEDLYQKYILFVDGQGEEIHNQFISNENILNSHFDLINFVDVSKHLKFNIEPIDLNRFEFNKQNLLGEGSFGKVFKIFDKETRTIYAAKILRRYLENYTINQVLNINREVNNISELNFPSIIKFIGFNQKNFNNKPKLTIITEFIPNGTLDDLIDSERENNHNEKWNETKKLIVIYGIASGMAYVHSHNIVHRDLKPANIFLDENLFPKIGDFGLSKKLNEKESIKKLIGQSGIKGSYAFIAPEIFTDLNYDKSADVFAFSLILYEILTNDPFYRSFSRYNILLNVPNGLRPEFQTEVPQCYKDLIQKCWANDPKERFSFNEIVDILKTDEKFITENVNKTEFIKYVQEIDQFLKINSDQ